MTNSLKKVILVLVACLSVSFAFAQQTDRSIEDAPKYRASQTTADLKAKLNLTNEQEKQVMELMTTAEMKKSGTELDSRVDAYVIEQMNTILSPSQMEVWMRNEAAKKPSGATDEK
jgi:hypothetical protein